MGILKLMDFLKNKTPKAIRSRPINSYENKVLAIDASNWIYQFLIKTQGISGGRINMPVDWMGNQTGHLIGILSRIQLCLTNNILPIWVFDGKPPEQKYQQLKKRRDAKNKAEQLAQFAIQSDSADEPFDLLKMSKRSVSISYQQKEDAKQLIKLIGLPVIQAKSEAQPQCAYIVQKGLAYGTISQDMDTLTFGCPKMIRSFNKKQDTTEIELNIILQQLDFSYDQFVDFCILCGCDYTGKIKGIGPVKAYQMLKKYNNIEMILQTLVNDQKLFKRHPVPDNFNHLRARTLFKQPQVYDIQADQVEMQPFQQQKFIKFLQQKQFSSMRISNWLQRNKKTGMLK